MGKSSDQSQSCEHTPADSKHQDQSFQHVMDKSNDENQPIEHTITMDKANEESQEISIDVAVQTNSGRKRTIALALLSTIIFLVTAMFAVLAPFFPTLVSLFNFK